MQKKIRKILFLACLTLFLIMAPLTVFYSQGYRINWQNKKIVKTGAFYFKVSPKQIEVWVDNQKKGGASLFFNTILIENLIPKEYKIRIQKQGYQSWEKILAIEETRVTEAKNIVLAPQNLGLDLLGKNIIHFWFSPDGEKILVQEKSIEETGGAKQEGLEEAEKDGWQLKLFDPEQGTKEPVFEKEDTVLLDAKWSPDSKRLLIKTKSKEKHAYYMLGTDKTPAESQELNLPQEVQGIYFHPNDSQKIMWTERGENQLLTLRESNLEGELAEKILNHLVTLAIDGQNIYWLTKDGFLQKSNLEGQSQFFSLNPLPQKQDSSHQIHILDAGIFLLEDKTLFLFNRQSKTFEQILNNVEHFLLSPDSKKICFWNGFEAGLFFLEKESSQPLRERGDKIFLTRFSEPIGDFSWWNNHYLVFKVKGNIKVIETDDRDKIQIWDLAALNNPNIYFNQEDKRLYILDNNSFFAATNF